MKRTDGNIQYEAMLDMLDELLDNAVKLPLSGGKCIVDEESFREIIAKMRTDTPQQILSASKIVADRMKILEGAKAESDEIIKKAQSRANDIVNNDDLAKQAAKQADEISKAATLKAHEIINAAREYSDDMLNKLDASLSDNLKEIRIVRQNLKKIPVSTIARGIVENKKNPTTSDGEE